MSTVASFKEVFEEYEKNLQSIEHSFQSKNVFEEPESGRRNLLLSHIAQMDYIRNKPIVEKDKERRNGSRLVDNRQMDPKLPKKEDVESVEMKDVEMQDDEE